MIQLAASDEAAEDIPVTHMQGAEEEEEVEEQQKDEDSFFGWPPAPDLIVPLVLVLVLLILTILLAWLLHRFAYPYLKVEIQLVNLIRRKRRSGKLELLRRESFPPRRPIILAGLLPCLVKRGYYCDFV